MIMSKIIKKNCLPAGAFSVLVVLFFVTTNAKEGANKFLI